MQMHERIHPISQVWNDAIASGCTSEKRNGNKKETTPSLHVHGADHIYIYMYLHMRKHELQDGRSSLPGIKFKAKESQIPAPRHCIRQHPNENCAMAEARSL
jgi:hypothetical protein